MLDLFVIKDFLDEAVREELVAGLRLADGGAATVYGRSAGGAVDPLVRKATRVVVSTEMRERVEQQMRNRMGAIEGHFGIDLSDYEEPQFLRYKTGDYFVAHQDGNTPLIFDQTRFRRISVVIFLNSQSADPSPDTYSGGSLVFHGPYSGPTLRLPASAYPGSLIAFRSEITHEVMPVTHGERYTIVSWYR
jgi:predicted 2-oxoglutarate/Fe(II)-dependent dioxygenase YbiX